MPNIHPLFVHFPIALLTASLVFDLLGVFLKRDEMTVVGWWLQLSGTLGLLVTLATGLLAKATVVIPVAAHDTFETHEEIAFLLAAGFAGLLLWRISSKTRIPRKLPGIYLVLTAVVIILMWAGAWLGGELVHRYAVGVG